MRAKIIPLRCLREAPFDDSYDIWFSEIKAKGQGMSIIPEFKISDHIDFYKNNDYDFLVDNPTALQIAGVPTDTAGIPAERIRN